MFHTSLTGAEKKLSNSYGDLPFTLEAGDYFGSSVAVADFNSDGVQDLFVGSISDGDGGSYSGAVYILVMTTHWL